MASLALLIGHEVYPALLPRSREAEHSFPCFHGVVFPVSFMGFLYTSKDTLLFLSL